MEEYLEKRMFVYRKSYNYYSNISMVLLVFKLLFSASGITAVYYLPLSFLSLCSGVIEIFEKSIKQNERLNEYRLSYKFYRQMLDLYKGQTLRKEEIYLREKEFIENIQFFPREKYIKEVEINGYGFV